MNFFKYIKAVGTGPKSNKNLSKEEIIEAIQGILEQKCESEQAAAFLMLLRVKLESDEELAGCLESFNKYITKEDIPESIELGFSYDGKTSQPYLFPLYGKILKEFFKQNKQIEPFDIVISGDKLQPAKNGLTVKDIADNITLEDNIHFFDRVNYFKELSDLTDLRKKLYMRTIFNTTEKLLNPANSKYAITSAFHRPYVEKYMNLFGDNYENLLIIKGNEGTPEIFSDFKYWVIGNSGIEEKVVKLEDLKIKYNNEYENITLDEAINIINNPSKEIMKLAKLNVAVLLYTTKRVESVEKAYEMLSDDSCCIVRFFKKLFK
jgi:anthranilate phosphoribosyltransferase